MFLWQQKKTKMVESNNNLIIEKLNELKREFDYYRDIFQKNMIYLAINNEKYSKKHAKEILNQCFSDYTKKRDTFEAEIEKINNQMLEICKNMIYEFTDYFLRSENRFNTNYYVERANEIFNEHAELVEFCNINKTKMYYVFLKMYPLKVDTETKHWVPFKWRYNLGDGGLVVAKCYLKYSYPEPPVIHRYNGCPIRLIIDKSVNLQLNSCIFPENFVEEGIVNIICNYLYH